MRAVVIHTASKLVVNVIGLPEGWTGEAEGDWTPPAGHQAQPHATAQIGWKRTGATLAPLPEPEPPPPTAEERRAAARLECQRRIFAAASANTQANMTAALAVISAKPAAERSQAEAEALDAFAAAVGWIGAMRARWPAIAADGLDPADDAQWPPLPAAAAALAARF